MSQVQEIIVYRSPAEMQMAHAMQNGDVFPIFAAIIAFFFVFISLNVIGGFIKFQSEFDNNRRYGSKVKRRINLQYVYLVIAGIAGVAVGNWLWL